MSATAASLPAPGEWSVRKLTLLIAGILLASFIAQWPGPRMADWQLFTFYDPGTILHGDLLLEKGYVPTVDFGYTHGLIPLLYGRVGFAFFGRTPWTFLGLTLLTEMVMAVALARILIASGLAKSKAALVFVLIGLPMAIMPAYLTLTHPLEAMLILLALAAQAQGNKSKALTTMTVCLFVKPSMAYVYGFLLVIMILWEGRKRPARMVRDLWPAAATLVVTALILVARFGWGPVFRTLLPLTGAKTYASTQFGFFSAATREQFWLPPLEQWWMYIGSPGTVYLLAAIGCAIGAVLALPRIFLRPSQVPENAAALVATRDTELLLTIGCLNTAFILGFYGYHDSWHYYSYLPVLGSALLMMLLLRGAGRTRAFIVASVLMFLSHGLLIGITIGAWAGKTPAGSGPAAEPGLWRYTAVDGKKSLFEQWEAVVKAAGIIGRDSKTLVLTNGYLFDLPANMEMQDAWFPEPGIPTDTEVARVKAQAQRAACVILFRDYSNEGVELWGRKEFAEARKEFVPTPVEGVDRFTLLRRISPAKND